MAQLVPATTPSRKSRTVGAIKLRDAWPWAGEGRLICLCLHPQSHTHIFRPCDYFSLVSHNLQELVDAVWDEDRWGSNGIGAWVGDGYWIMCYHVFCFLFMFLIFFSVFFNDFYVCTMLFLFVNCIMLHWFQWKEFDESSGHGHSAVHVIHSATPRTRRLRGEIWFSKTFVRCDAGNWAFKASFSSQRGVV